MNSTIVKVMARVQDRIAALGYDEVSDQIILAYIAEVMYDVEELI